MTCVISPNTIMAPVQAASAGCENVQTMCAKGFYPDREDCKPCSQTEVLCEWGSYPSCAGACVPCSKPSLPSSSYRYGRGAAYRDCINERTPDPSICAWFQTPQWGTGYCEVICAEGYAPAPGSAPGGCQRCKVESECPLGWLAPTSAECGSSAECIQCALPEGTRWYGSIGCNFTCLAAHHYYSAAQTKCVPCPDCGEGQYPAGCGGVTAGVCRPCALNCSFGPAAHGSFLQLADCSCRICTSYFDMNPYLQPAAFFIIRDCTATADTVFETCSQDCPNGYFKTGDCQPRADITCGRCSLPPPGAMTASPCNTTHDTAFAPCPSDWIRLGYACHGGVRANCSSGMRPNEDGVCACPPGTLALAAMNQLHPHHMPSPPFRQSSHRRLYAVRKRRAHCQRAAAAGDRGVVRLRIRLLPPPDSAQRIR